MGFENDFVGGFAGDDSGGFVAVFEFGGRAGTEAAAIEERAVNAAQVFHIVAIGLAQDADMAARHAGVVPAVVLQIDFGEDPRRAVEPPDVSVTVPCVGAPCSGSFQRISEA